MLCAGLSADIGYCDIVRWKPAALQGPRSHTIRFECSIRITTDDSTFGSEEGGVRLFARLDRDHDGLSISTNSQGD